MVDKRPYIRPSAHEADIGEVEAATDGVANTVSVVDTTELRWFALGTLPSEVGAWFTRGGTVGVIEERSDTYRIDGRFDRGVKRRFRETLELKVRRSVGDEVRLEADLGGRLEDWRKWSPAEGLVEIVRHGPWADVTKTVVKRRFALDGTEVPLSLLGPAPTEAGCDVEIVAIRVDGVEAWTFAFAAYGPSASRPEAIVAAWRSLMAESPCPAGFTASFSHEGGYPEFLAFVVSPDRVPSSR